MTLYAAPALFALFAWWFSTGLIMYLDGLPRQTFRYSMAGATALLGAALWGLHATRADTSVGGAYLAFSCGLLAWGWQEISFYMGFVTGPRQAPCVEGCAGWRHFGHAIQTSLWHELAIIAAALAVGALTWGGGNQVGTWTFMVLWWMHQSAKLNVFLGVRNLNEEFLPDHLQFLRSFLTKKPMNLLFPVSITVSTMILVRLVQAAIAPDATPFQAAGFCFLATLMGLAILEHWLLMLPLPAAALWGWSLRSRAATSPFDVEIVSGFLGAGKTTFLRARLAGAGPRTVVLVNDFAAMGVDGSLLRERGADVVELPNGCICCSLRQDLARQLKTVVAAWSPERVLIEPSGVADLASLLGVLQTPELRPLVREMTVTTILDAGAFLADYARLGRQLDAQVRLASALVVNKTDLVSAAELAMLENTLRGLNPQVPLLRATFGIAAPASSAAFAATASSGGRRATVHPHVHATEHADPKDGPADHQDHADRFGGTAPRRQANAARRDATCRDMAAGHAGHSQDDHYDCDDDRSRFADADSHAVRPEPGEPAGARGFHGHHHRPDAAVHAHHPHRHERHDHDHAADGLDFASWSSVLAGTWDTEPLSAVLDRLASGSAGRIERLKGIARAANGWLRFDLAGGHATVAAFAPRNAETPRVVAIGRDLDTEALAAAFAASTAAPVPAAS